MNKKYIYGIDFGTTNSALSIIDVETNEIVKTFNEASLIYFPEPKSRRAPLTYFVGKEAVEKYVAGQMKGRFMKSIKRILPRSAFTGTKVFSQKFQAENLVSIILEYLKKLADDFLGEDIKAAVFGRPVVFDENPEKDQLAQNRLLLASRLAGFESVEFQMEPIAAAFTYERNITKDELVLVADFGGGTSDFTLMKLSPDRQGMPDRKSDIVGQGGIYIGGDNFDASIMWEKGTYHFGRGLTYKDFDTVVDVPLSFYHNICSWEKMNFFDSLRLQSALDHFYFLTGRHPRFANLVTLIRNNLGYSLFQAVEKAKIALSNLPETSFEFRNGDIEIEETITIEDFSKTIIGGDVEKIRKYLLTFIKELGVDVGSVNTVFVTGGTSMVKPIKMVMIELFGEEALKSGDNFNSVANGLAYSHCLFPKLR